MNEVKTATRPSASVLVTDLDDTLWNWFDLWYSAFKPMLDCLVKKLGISEEALKAEIKASEYSFLLQELPSIREKYGTNFNPYSEFPDVIQAYRDGRKSASRLNPGVLETLKAIRAKGSKIAGYTESQFFYTTQRIRVLGLDGIIDVLYSTQDRGLPTLDALEQLRNKPESYYRLQITKTVVLPFGTKKPDPNVLLKIVSDLHSRADDVIYVGDKLSKDVFMANQAGIRSVHAAYGEVHNDPRYELLRDVTHWTPEDVINEKNAKVDGVKADYTLKNSFAELLDVFEFKPYTTYDSGGN
jgi:phosphoglycolate phosphatase